MRFTRQILILALGSLVGVAAVLAQFSSGSTGTDGAYSPTVSGDFDPVALGLNSAGDNVFNFTTINIPAGVTINLLASNLRNKAVTWLAQGNVTIAGTLNLSGASGGQVTVSSAGTPSGRAQTEPGPGGYAGGVGSQGGVGPEVGAGPGGGPAGLQSGSTSFGCYGGNGSFINASSSSPSLGLTAGPTYGSYLLVPLYGGSGGGGGWDSASANNVGGVGGAGGGAIRIASNTQINVTGTINANGGSGGTVSGSTAGCPGGAGAGGAIHLVAPTIIGNGSITAYSIASLFGQNNTGIIRFSTTTNSFTGNAQPNFIQSALYLPPANSTLSLPSLTIKQVNGVAVPASAGGQVLSPDVVISANSAVAVNLAASNIPLGTVVSLRVTAQTGGDTTISCTALAGTLAASTATCSATFPFAISIADVRAKW